MGYANIPMAIGWGYGSFVGGQLYERAGEKAGLALRYLSEVLRGARAAGPLPGLRRLDGEAGADPGPGDPLLWDTYDPSQVWTPFAVAGLVAAVAMLSIIAWPGAGRT